MVCVGVSVNVQPLVGIFPPIFHNGAFQKGNHFGILSFTCNCLLNVQFPNEATRANLQVNKGIPARGPFCIFSYFIKLKTVF